MDARGHVIGGQERPSRSGGAFPVRAPATRAILGHAARGTADDVDAAVLAASSAFATWSALPPADRERALLRAADAIDARAARFVDLVIDEGGGTITKARGEVAYASQLFRAAAGEVRRLYGETLPHDDPSRMSIVIREPLGVVGVISPFNAPLALLAKMVAFPLAAGNAVVAKPSELTPLVAVELACALAEAGLPPGVLNVVTGLGAECGDALVRHPAVRGIAFTGSTAVGAHIGAAIAPQMKRVQLELGGKNALVVLADADPDDAAACAVAGAYAHAGQICMAASRLVVEAPVADAFMRAFVGRAEALVLGDLRDPRTAYGPLVTEAALAKVEEQVRAAVDDGARLVTGGRVHEGLTYRPTLLAEPKLTSRLWREETFGPVACLVTARDFEHAIALANDSDMGLSAGIFTRDVGRAFAAARRIRCGSVHIGSHPFHSNALAPIGGYGLSGVGRSGGKYSVDEFTELKWITWNAEAR